MLELCCTTIDPRSSAATARNAAVAVRRLRRAWPLERKCHGLFGWTARVDSGATGLKDDNRAQRCLVARAALSPDPRMGGAAEERPCTSLWSPHSCRRRARPFMAAVRSSIPEATARAMRGAWTRLGDTNSVRQARQLMCLGARARM